MPWTQSRVLVIQIKILPTFWALQTSVLETCNLDFFFEVIFNEELGRLNSGGFLITQQVVQYMSAPYIYKYGSEDLKNKYLPGIISGDIISCIGITEPDAGSDTKNIKTKAL